jgi:hypothetical protein
MKDFDGMHQKSCRRILDNDSILLELIALLAPREGNRDLTRHPVTRNEALPERLPLTNGKISELNTPSLAAVPLFCAFHFRIEYRSASLPLVGVQLPNIDRLKKAPPSQLKCDTVHPLHVCSTRSKQASQMRLVWGFLSSARSRRSQVERKIVQGENTSDRCGFSTYRSESAGSDRGFTLWTG